MPQDSTDIYKRNIVIRYIIKPEEATLLCILYQLRAKLIEKESQPNKLPNEFIVKNHLLTNNHTYPNRITLNTREKLRCSKS